MSLLLVDDSKDQSRALCTLMRYGGINVHYVESGNEALAFLKAHPVRVILLDAMMPDVSGWEVLKSIRSQPRYDDLHVLMYSAVDDPQWDARARALGADDYLVKTKVTFADLREIVQKYINLPRVSAERPTPPTDA